MDILIIAHFCGELENEGNSRFFYLANLLCKEHEVEIVTSDFSHGLKKYKKKKINEHKYRITQIHETGYSTNLCLKRLYSHFIWGMNIKKYLRIRKHPDVVYCAVPSLTASYEVAKYCRKNKIRFIIDIQDLWPEAFEMVFNIPILNSIVFFPFRLLADGIYKRADEICAVSNTYAERALTVNHRCQNPHTIFLGTDLETFDRNVDENVFLLNGDTLKIGYCGTLGSSYDLICVIDALALLKKNGIKPPQFIILGDGPLREKFERYVKDNEIDAIFFGYAPYNKMCGILSQCDIVVNPIKKRAAQSIINKHADYAASGLPVLNTQESREYRDLVDKYKMGFNCNNNDPKDLAEKIQILMNNQSLRIEFGINARKCAVEMFDRKTTYKEIINIIEGN